MCSATSDALVHRLVAFAEREGFTKSALASKAGLKDTTLRHFGRPTWNPTLRIIKKIEGVIPADFNPDAAA